MKEKILAALKTKYGNLGLGAKVLEGIADMLAVTTTEEANIETAVNGVETLVKGFQSDADKRVTDAVAKAKKDAEKPKEEAPKEDAPKPGEEVPAYMKTLLDGFKVLETKLTALEGSKVQDTRKGTLEKALEKANPAFKTSILKGFSRMSFNTDEEFAEYLEEVKTDSANFIQAEADDALGGTPAPNKGNGTPPAKAAVLNDIKEWAEANKPAAA